MEMIAAIAITCWCCALIAAPRKPLPGNEVQELVYARLLGRQRRMALVALVVTAAAFIALLATVPARLRAETDGVTERRQVCYDAPQQRPTCYSPLLDGTWAVEQMQADGIWRPVNVVPRPPAYATGTGG